MATRDEQIYDIYVRTYGKVQSGAKLTNADYGTMTARGFDPFPVDGKAVVGMAAQDVKLKAPMRSMPDVLAQVRALMPGASGTLPATAGGSGAVPAVGSPAPPTSNTKSATKMIGDWRVIRSLGRSGQGDVDLVERTSPKEHALGVLKRVRADVADDPKRLGRLKHEIETVRDLKHPFIAELLDSNFNDYWLVTRYAPLGSLNDHLAWFKGDAWRTLRMARDIAIALGVAHQAGVIHRDVKPPNILLYDPNHVALTDFGIAHDDDQTEVTSSQERVGAQWFRPPEAEHGRCEPTAAFDIYMLGKVTYVTLTGGKRFARERFKEGEADVEKMFGRPEFAAVNRLFERMIVENPGDRFQDTSAVVAAIDSALAEIFGKGIVDANAYTDAKVGDVATILARLASLEQAVQAHDGSTSHLKGRIDALSEWSGVVRSQFKEIVGEVSALANASANPGGRYAPNWKINKP